MKNAIEFNWELLGAKVVNLPEADQALFFKGFANELDSLESHCLKETRMIDVGKQLNIDVKRVLKKYLPVTWGSKTTAHGYK